MPGQELDGLLTPIAMLFDVLQEAQAARLQPDAVQGVRSWRHGFHDTLKAAGQSAGSVGIRSVGHIAALLGPYLRQSVAADDLEHAHGLTALLFSFLCGDLDAQESGEMLDLVSQWVRPLTPLPDAVKRLVAQSLIQDSQMLAQRRGLGAAHDEEVRGKSTGTKTVALDEMALVAQAWGECAQLLATLCDEDLPTPSDLALDGLAGTNAVSHPLSWLALADRLALMADAVGVMGLQACSQVLADLSSQVQMMQPSPGQVLPLGLSERQRAVHWREVARLWQSAFESCDPDAFWKAVASLEAPGLLAGGLSHGALNDARIELLALQVIESRQLSLRPEAADEQALSLAWPAQLDSRVQQPLLLELNTLARRLDSHLARAMAVGSAPMQECLRCAHGIKGAAQGAGIAGLARFAHAIEDLLICLDRDGLASDPRLSQSLSQACGMLLQIVDRLPSADPAPEGFAQMVRALDAEVHRRALSQQRPQQRPHSRMIPSLISSPDLDGAPVPGHGHAGAPAAHPGLQVSAAEFLGPWLDQCVRQAALASGKQAELKLDAPIRLDGRVLGELSQALGHLLRNAVDHGIEVPAIRLAQGKPAAGCILVSFRRTGGGDGPASDLVEIRVQDDGAGLDLMRVRERAVALGLVTARQAALSDDGQVADWIFAPGLSTRPEVSMISGRGVGMDAVRASIERLRGTISLRTLSGRGTTVLIRVPSQPGPGERF